MNYATIPFCGERDFTLVFETKDTYGKTVLFLNKSTGYKPQLYFNVTEMRNRAPEDLNVFGVFGNTPLEPLKITEDPSTLVQTVKAKLTVTL